MSNSRNLSLIDLSDEPLRDVQAVPLTNIQIFVRVPQDADAEAIKSACEDAVKAAAPSCQIVRADVHRFSVARPCKPTPATNSKLSVHHVMTSAEVRYSDGDIHGYTACRHRMVADTTGAAARKKPKCDECYAALDAKSQ